MKSHKSANLMSTLQHLLDYAELSANGLAKILNVPTPTIYRLTTGDVQDPRISTLTMLAEYFGVGIEQLLGKRDLDAHFYTKNPVKYLRPISSIPLFNFNETYTIEKSMKNPKAWLRWKLTEHPDEYEQLFAVVINNNLYDPLFSQHTNLIVDPIHSPENGDYVLVNFKGDHMSVLKRYMTEARHKYLMSLTLDGNATQFNSNEATIIGVIIESYRNFKN